MGAAQAKNVVVHLSLKANLDDVFAVDWKDMTNRQTAARREWEAFAHSTVLIQQFRNMIGIETRRRGGIPPRQPADHSGGGQVSFDEDRRDRKSSCRIIETALTGGLINKNGPAVYFKRKQVSDGIYVFGTVQ